MNKRKFLPLILPIVILIFWYIITDGISLVKPYVLPSPVAVLYSAISIIQSGKLLQNTIDTLFKVFAGLILASLVAIPSGILLGWYETLEELCSFVISILRPIPPVAWIPFQFYGLELVLFLQYLLSLWGVFSRFWFIPWMV